MKFKIIDIKIIERLNVYGYKIKVVLESTQFGGHAQNSPHNRDEIIVQATKNEYLRFHILCALPTNFMWNSKA